jgi:plasmid stabilization system protein ParE
VSLVRLSAAAEQHIEELRAHYRRKGRFDAIHNMTNALRVARRQIAQGRCRASPLPYPELEAEGQAWTHAGSYWFVFTTTKPAVVLGVFYDRADLPSRHEAE